MSWAAGVRISWLDPVSMFLAVWMLYAADRLLDANPLFTAPSSLELEERHHFHHRHRKAFLYGIAAVILPLLLLLHRTVDAVLHLYVLLASLLGVWLLLIHALPAPSATSHRLPKELAVGVFFSAAVFIPTIARAPALRPGLAIPAILFAALCTLNCLFLYAWEHPQAHAHAHATTLWAVRHLNVLALTCSVLATVLFLMATVAPRLSPWHLRHTSAAFLTCALSAFLLLGLHSRRAQMSRLTLRALADLVLLTPVPVFFVMVVAGRR